MERFSALVICRDADVLRIVNKAFEEHRLEAAIAGDFSEANELAKARRFDLAICDYDLADVSQLAYLKPGSPWRGMLVALLRQDRLDEVHGKRVHLTLPKPLTHRLFSRGLRAVRTGMAQERRTNFRYPVEIEALAAGLVDRGKHRTLVRARILDISRTGICLEAEEPLPLRASVQISFELPHNEGRINAEGQVAWTESRGRAGIQFTRLSSAAQGRLAEWLDARLPAEFTRQ